jgi:LPS-assembly protein
VVRRLLRLLAICTPVLAASVEPLIVSGDLQSADLGSKETTYTGHFRIGDGTFLITADEGRYNADTEEATVTGHVVFTRGVVRLLTDRLVYHRREGTFTASSVRVGAYPVYVEGSAASGTAEEITVEHATATYGEPGPWQPTLKADRIVFSPGKKLRAEQASLGVGSAQPIHLPQFEQNLHDPLVSYFSLLGGYRSNLGAFLILGTHLPVAPGVKLGGDLGFYTARGLMFGPSGTYSSPDDPDALNGSFRSGFIQDHGDRMTDVLGRPVPESRGYVEWTHQQQVTDNLTVTADANYWKDSYILRDFRPNEYYNVQQPDNFAEALYTGPNYFVSLFARYEANNFEEVQQRLPELDFDLLPLALGHGFYEEFHAGAALLREDPVTGGPELRSDRLDAYYGIRRPFTPANWLSFTPVAGVRVTDYSDTAGAALPGGYTRTLGEFGFDAELRSSGVFDVKSDRWKIDGLRHLLTPVLSYRYIPGGDAGRSYIPDIDRETFSTYLPPLDLGVTRNIDDLHPLNTLRVGLDNTLQTRDPVYGSRDLVVFDTAADFDFHQEAGEQTVSQVHSELAVMPAAWLQLGVYESFTPQTFSLQQFNSSLTLHDGTAWSVRFLDYYLRHDTQNYAIDGTLRMNEIFSAVARMQYDARLREFVAETFGLRQNIGNTWRLEYNVSVSNGQSREGHFGFNVQIMPIRF